MKKNLSMLAGFGALLILAGAGCAAPKAEDANMTPAQPVKETQPAAQTEQTTTVTETKPEATTETKPAAMGSGLTAAEVAKHNTRQDCYIIVRDSVFNVTSYIDRHPAGPDAIIPLCGTDATSAFSNQHGGQPKPENMLASLKIGELKK